MFRHRLRSSLGIHAALAVASFIYLIPLLVSFGVSLQPSQRAAAGLISQIRGGSSGPGGLGNYLVVVSDQRLWRWTLTSVEVTATTIVGIIIVSLVSGYVFSRVTFPYKNLLYILFLTTLLIPVQVIIVPLFALLKALRLINSPFALIGPYLATFPFYMVILKNYIDNLPRDLFDAAYIDGANHYQVIRHVILPLSQPALAVVVIYAFLFSWNDFMLPLLVFPEQTLGTATLAPLRFVGIYTVQWNMVYAVAMVLIIPPVLIFLYMQRWYVRGLIVGATK